MFDPSPKPTPLFVNNPRVRTYGELHVGSVLIVMYERVLDQILDFSETDTRREVGGFLLGGLHEHDGDYVEVRHFLPAEATKSRSASLTFTHATWAALNRVAEEQYPDDLILGWHHTHPNFGIFLSGYDLFIHRHFFSQPWQIAQVVDPVRHELGFFQWCGDEIVSCGVVVCPEG